MDDFDYLSKHLEEVVSDNESLEALVALSQIVAKVKFFAKLRELIAEKDLENDETASYVLGWAYERLADELA